MFWGCDTAKNLQWLFLNDENNLAFAAAVSDPDPVMAVTAEVEERREREEGEGGEEEKIRESILFSVWEEEDESMAKAQMRGSVRRTTSHQLLRTAVSI